MRLKILIVLNYYYPYISGLSECAKSLAEELAKEHDVTVLTAKHEKNLLGFEIINGVKIERADLLFKISKGYISLDFLSKFYKHQKNADIVNLHLPMAEAAFISHLTSKEKLILTYQCDVNLPRSMANSIIVNLMDKSSRSSFKRARGIVVSSYDYARSSRVLPKFKDKWLEIHPTSSFYKEFNSSHNRSQREEIYVGFCGRIVEEKGIDILLQAAPIVKKALPNVRFLIAGDFNNVAGGSIYESLKLKIGWDESYVEFLGRLSTQQLIDFYYSLDLFVLPSTNSLEAFGMVQIEAMLAGVPVVASHLPGVREITRRTGMGETANPKDVEQLAEVIIKVLKDRDHYIKEKSFINEIFGVESAAAKYNVCFKEVLNLKAKT
ncbi:glycosyltransferase family 4 protein [Paenibacillus sp. 19GGS1-52]|uniref:glycosyltransferase family 4 protein n=1 Tax=Paenibacillus sp. 19GGS1-52 TaxID=2758563 RepID=UPI001EFB83FD|nr:glycosyltransferase family 4 protein [Paenibacillus sp. 19GGS1-52]ULO08042.1 glycosyltransferase family 4 protein [Paenibacillus sp. 19GGS1-52]